MRFFCDACNAQYLISDEKVGSAGVKVRCKRCGHVIVVRRQAAAVPAVPRPPEPPVLSRSVPLDGEPGVASDGPGGVPAAQASASAPWSDGPGPGGGRGPLSDGGAPAASGMASAPWPDGSGHDDDLGPAFDGRAAGVAPVTPGPRFDGSGHDGERVPLFDGRAADGASDAPVPGALGGGVPDPEATRIFSSDEMAKLVARAEAPAAAVPAASPVEWFVAIDDQQVGPLAFEEVKRRWEEGALGPASLCWRSGLADWTPIGEIAELAGRLSPSALPEGSDFPMANGGAAAPREVFGVDDPWNLPAPQPTSEFEWKPAAGSALSALVQQEVAALERPSSSAVRKHVPEELPPPESTGIRSLLSNLPEPPPPEPSRVIPFPERAHTGSQPLPKAAREPEPTKAPAPALRPSGLKNALVGGLVAAAAVVAVLVGLAWAGILPGRGTVAEPAPAPVVEAPQAVVPAPEPVAVAPAPVPEAPPPPEEVVAATPPPEPEVVEKAPPAPAPASAEPRKPVHRERRVAGRTGVEAPAPKPRPVPAPAPTPAPETSGRRSDIDDLFDREFSGSAAASKGPAAKAPDNARGDVYIPEAPGSASSKPQQLGQGDVMAVVVGHKATIKKCAEGYKAQGGGTGTLVMVWTIQQSGKTSGVKPKGSDHAPLAKCIGGLIQGWQFPEYAGPTMAPIEFPFQF